MWNLLLDINDPISQDMQAAELLSSFVDEAGVSTLVSFGFEEGLARKALKASVRLSFLLSISMGWLKDACDYSLCRIKILKI